MEGAAIRGERDVQPVPVYGGGLRQVIAETDDDTVPLVDLQERARRAAIVREDSRFHAGHQLQPGRRRREVNLHRLRLAGHVVQHGRTRLRGGRRIGRRRPSGAEAAGEKKQG
jgi:hypothetical protein